MPASQNSPILTPRRALCVGIGTYTHPSMKDKPLEYAPADAVSIAEALRTRGDFETTLLTEPAQTESEPLRTAIEDLFSGPPDSLALLFISSHGDRYGSNQTFYLLPSNADVSNPVSPKNKLGLFDLAGFINDATVKNIVIWLDVCHAAGAAELFSKVSFEFKPDVNIFIGGAARHDRTAAQFSDLQHGVYTHSLLKAFEQMPDHGDGSWLSVTCLQRYIQQEIKRLNRKEQRPKASLLQFPGMYKFDDVGLLILQNPACKFDNPKFHSNVRELLTLADYEEQELQPGQYSVPPNFFSAHKGDGIVNQNYAFLTIFNRYESVTVDFVNAVAPFLAEQQEISMSHVLIVSSSPLLPNVRQRFQKLVRGIQFLGQNSLTEGLLPGLDIYLEYWRKEYEVETRISVDPPLTLAKVYVPVRAEKRKIVEKPEQSNRYSLSKLRRDEITKEFYEETDPFQLDIYLLKEWLPASGQSGLALLGNYGTGKSSTALWLVATLAKQYLNSHSGRIPLYVPLLKLAEGRPDLQRLTEYIRDLTGKAAPKPAILKRLASQGRLVFVLDGFDEMAAQADTNTIRRNIALFEELIKLKGNKVLLTTRPEYFLGHQEEANTLKNYERLYLQPYTPAQILEYLNKRFGPEQATKDWERLRDIHDLPDLANRPLFLAMIAQTMPRLRQLEKINRPQLYEDYLRDELKRQYDKERFDLQIDDDKRFRLDEEIALELYRTGRFQDGLDEKEIRRLFEDSPLLTGLEYGQMRNYTREIVACSFLINPPPSYTFRFSHKSFLEYFLALALRRALRNDDFNEFERYDIFKVAAPSLEFLAEMLLTEPDEGQAALTIIQKWLAEVTSVPGLDGEVVWGNLEANCAGLLLAYRVLKLEAGQVSGFVTHAEYQLFIEEQQVGQSYLQPLHWQTYRFPADQALNPVRGLTYTAAQRFIGWLDERFKNVYEHWLPADDQISLNIFSDLGYWTRTGQITALGSVDQSHLQKILTDLTGYPELNLDLARDGAAELAYEPTNVFESVLSRALDFTRDLTRALSRTLNSDYALSHALSLELNHDIARNLVITRPQAFTSVKYSIKQILKEDNMDKLLQVVHEKSLYNERTSDRNLALLIAGLLEMQLAFDFDSLSQAYRKFVQNFAEIVLGGLPKLIWEKDELIACTQLKELMERVLGWVKQAEARSQGELLPAWEGLRFVRERPEDEDE